MFGYFIAKRASYIVSCFWQILVKWIIPKAQYYIWEEFPGHILHNSTTHHLDSVFMTSALKINSFISNLASQLGAKLDWRATCKNLVMYSSQSPTKTAFIVLIHIIVSIIINLSTRLLFICMPCIIIINLLTAPFAASINAGPMALNKSLRKEKA